MLTLEYMPWWLALLIFAGLAVPIVWLGVRSMAGLGKARQWASIVLRLLVAMVMVLLLAGARFERANQDVEVMVVRDVSESTTNVRLTSIGGQAPASLEDATSAFVRQAMLADKEKRASDRVGIISFDNQAYVDAIAGEQLMLDARSVRPAGTGTDVAAALELALATLRADAMSRIVLVWDGNMTSGDLDAVLAKAAANRVPIDVVPLDYEVKNEVIVDRFIAPTWKRENEPFTIEVLVRSTNPQPVTGSLTVMHQDRPMDMDSQTPGLQASRLVTLRPGVNVERVSVPALREAGVHQFKAIFEAPNTPAGSISTATNSQATNPPATNPPATNLPARQGDSLLANNVASAFTFVRGKGRILYIDGSNPDAGNPLAEALAREAIEIERRSADEFPGSLVELQNFDAVVLNNVRRGVGGLSDEQQQLLATYVHDMGGGLVMVGGDEAFGAGGWAGSKLEEVLPVDMEIPAQRQIAKGALVLLMHSTEMPQGNFWGEQCAIKASETLSSKDEIGVMSWAWQGGGGTQWDFPLAERGDGTRVVAAIKNMQLGDMPDFSDAMLLALDGSPGKPGLIASDARQKHMIIISDGDPQPPPQSTIKRFQDAQISVSTISVYPHGGSVPATMADISRATGGRVYGPIESNPQQLPQIFTKEATVVRRTLIVEKKEGIPVKPTGFPSELVKGIDLSTLPGVFGMVLTSKKQSPQVEMPLVAGENNDPLLASWQAGLGKSAVFTSDAFSRWGARWVGMSAFDKFWSQIVRGVARPAESADFDVNVKVEGTTGTIIVEAIDPTNSSFKSLLKIRGTVVGPDMRPREVELTQVGPGKYSANFKAEQSGNYVAGLVYSAPQGQGGMLRSGTVVNASPELRDLKSNRAAVEEVARSTGGRVLAAFDAQNSRLFTRDGLSRSSSPLPIWDTLIMLLLGLMLLDVACRRIAWDEGTPGRLYASARGFLGSFVVTRKVETSTSVDALRQIRERGQAASTTPTAPADQPDKAFKFQAAENVEGNLSDLVGGATNKDLPKARTEREKPKGGQTTDKPDSMGSLLDAKKRARDKMDEKN